MPYEKYKIEFKDDFNRLVTVLIVQDEIILTPTMLVAADNPVTVRYDGDESDIFQTMIPSKAKIRILLPEDNLELYEDLSTIDEDTFGVTITVEEDDDIVFAWNGWLIPDELTRTFSYQDQTMELTAIDVISRLKGQRLVNSDGTYIVGRQTMKYIVSRCLDEAFTTSNTIGSYEIVVKSHMVLSVLTSYEFPDVLEQLSVAAEAFNDDMGRPISAFEVVERIARSLLMRVFYENSTVYFVDILDYQGDMDRPEAPVLFKDYPGVTLQDNNIIIGNDENITTSRTFRESNARFQYTNTIGILIDGNLNNWEESGTGYRLTNWFYNPYLEARPDVDDRRVGNGRAESPYGILLTYTNDGTTPPITGRKYDMICSKVSVPVSGGIFYTINVRMRLVNPLSIDFADISGTLARHTYQILFIFVYNDYDPSKCYAFSWMSGGDGHAHWVEIALAGTDFEDGIPDWSVITAAYESELSSNTTVNTFGAANPALIIEATPAFEIQELSYDLPPLPIGVIGTMYVAVHPCTGAKVDLHPESADTVIYSCILTQKGSFFGPEKTKGETVYITRKIRTSQDKLEREISFNTTENSNVAGSISTDITYEDNFGNIIPAGNVPVVSISNVPELFGLPILGYNAIALMWLNYPQYKIDFTVRGKILNFYDAVILNTLYDPGRPSTAIYQEVFIQNSHEYDLKMGTRKLVVMSMKINKRIISDVEPDETHDAGEFYYIK